MLKTLIRLSSVFFILVLISGCIVLVSVPDEPIAATTEAEQNKDNIQELPPVQANLKEPVKLELAPYANTQMQALKFAKNIRVKEKKRQFFAFIKPLVDAENRRIQAERNYILSQKNTDTYSEQLLQLAIKYEIFSEPQQGQQVSIDFEQLLKRVNVVPTELALVQSANESMWGQSRFAQQGNNIFGQWCYNLGCGLVPKGRQSDKSHEVRRFDSVAESIASYMLNLNTHNAYRKFRQVRADMQTSQALLDSDRLADGLVRYSIRGQAYVTELKNMLRVNKKLMR